MDAAANTQLTPVTELSATIFRADGTIEELGVIARSHSTEEAAARDLHDNGVGHVKREAI